MIQITSPGQKTFTATPDKVRAMLLHGFSADSVDLALMRVMDTPVTLTFKGVEITLTKIA